MIGRTLGALWWMESFIEAIPPRIKAILAGMIILHLLQIYHVLPVPSL